MPQHDDDLWLHSLHAAADQPPRRPRWPLRADAAGGAAIGSVEPDFLGQIGLQAASRLPGQLSKDERSADGPCWRLHGGDLDAALAALADALRAAGLAGREADFRNGLLQALDTAAAFGCPRIHVLAGLAPPGGAAAGLAFRRNLAWAAARAADAGRALSIEALNAHDVPGYHLATQAQAHAVCASVGAPNLGVQLDAWHVACTEGDVAAECERALPTGRVVHIQVAGQPGRHEPWHDPHTDWPALFARIDALGFAGWIGCEYLPRHGLRWRSELLQER